MGFEAPNHTQVPNDLFDVYLPQLKAAELRVLLTVIRQTIGFHRKKRRMSVTFLAGATGLSGEEVADAATSLLRRGLVTTGWEANRGPVMPLAGEPEWMVGWREKPVDVDRILFYKSAIREKRANKQPTQKEENGYVYLVRDHGGCYKIGRTTNLQRRIWDQISPVLPYPLELVAALATETPASLESTLHLIFDEKRLGGEWFKLTNDDVEVFRRWTA